jgi:hypothetical protein
MTADELYDIKLQVEDITEKLYTLAKEYSYDPFRNAALVSERLEECIFDCVGKLAAYEICKRRENL